MRKALMSLALFAVVLLVPVTWALQTLCVDCDGGANCVWQPRDGETICTEFAGGNGCVAGGGTCEYD